MKKLEILNVDLDMLEEQRKTLAELSNLLHNQQDYRIGNHHLDALDVVIYILNTWSDERYFSRCGG